MRRETTSFRQQAPLPATTGFSLIEVLIATTILLVIVVLVSMVFQQQSGAFQSGVDRVKGQTVLRNVVGMVARDLAMAVDSEDYNGLSGDSRNKFNSRSISFLTFGGEADGDTLPLQRVTYSLASDGVTREVREVKFSDGGWAVGGGSSAQIASGLENLNFTAIGGSDTFPNAVTIHAEVSTDGRTSFVIGRSAGPNGRLDNPMNSGCDDIFAGGRPNN